jgi:hypothetical protein
MIVDRILPAVTDSAEFAKVTEIVRRMRGASPVLVAEDLYVVTYGSGSRPKICSCSRG